MIYEFALEPKLVASWGDLRNYRFYSRAFGIGQPRMMAEYPKLKNWRRQVLQAAQGVSDIEFSRVTELVSVLSECMVSRNGGYDGTIGWLPNAEQEHTRMPFHAIVAKHNPNRNPAVLTDEHLGIGANERWDLPRSASPNRNTEELAGSVAGMLQICGVIVLVDPHFGPENSRHRKFLSTILRTVMERNAERPMPSRIEMQTSDKADENFFRSESEKWLPKIIPQGLSLRIVRWTQRDGGEKLHNRYILTELGGVSFQVGLDEGHIGETEDIDLMERDRYEKRWSQYAGNKPAFDRCGDPFEIVGIASRCRPLS